MKTTSQFSQIGQIVFTSRNWKAVVNAISAQANTILLLGIKDGKHHGLSICKANGYRATIKLSFIKKLITTPEGISVDRRNYLLNIISEQSLDGILIRWGYQNENPVKKMKVIATPIQSVA